MSLWVHLTPPVCPCCKNIGEDYTQNITHNLRKMADEAGIYYAVWRPEEIGIRKAEQLIAPLRAAIAAMEANPAMFKKHDSPNGWGMYVNFLPWLKDYLAACERMPDAGVEAS